MFVIVKHVCYVYIVTYNYPHGIEERPWPLQFLLNIMFMSLQLCAVVKNKYVRMFRNKYKYFELTIFNYTVGM